MYRIEGIYDRIQKAWEYKGYKNGRQFSLATADEQGPIIKEQTISRWKKGQSVPDIDSLLSICNLCDVDIDYLLGNMENCKTRDTQFIHDKTGLSEEAIQTLTKYKDGNLDIDFLNNCIIQGLFTKHNFTDTAKNIAICKRTIRAFSKTLRDICEIVANSDAESFEQAFIRKLSELDIAVLRTLEQSRICNIDDYNDESGLTVIDYKSLPYDNDRIMQRGLARIYVKDSEGLSEDTIEAIAIIEGWLYPFLNKADCLLKRKIKYFTYQDAFLDLVKQYEEQLSRERK